MYSQVEQDERELAAHRSKRQALVAERDRLYARLRGGERSSGLSERLGNLDRAIARLDELVAAAEERQARFEYARQVATSPAHTEHGVPEWERECDMQASRQGEPRLPERDRALRAIEKHAGVLASDAADRLDTLLRRRDPTGLAARYLAAVADDAYERAFGLILRHPTDAHLRFGPAEVEAVRRVAAVQAERGLVEGTGAAGGFGVPFQLDPTIVLSSDGALNPIRQLARVIEVVSNVWKGVSSDGVTASYDPEASEVSDDTPTLAQPVVSVATGRAFVPFSLELGQDWPGLAEELRRLLADARDTLDAGKFLTGSGVNEPAGVLTGLSAGQEVLTGASLTLAVGDVYGLREALPARFAPGASFLAHPAILDQIYRLVGTGDPNEPPLMPDRAGGILGARTFEVSVMASTLAANAKVLLYGDFANYLIVDRVGMSVELIPHLFGANRRPTGERGLFAYWRTGAAVLVPNAFRVLKVKP